MFLGSSVVEQVAVNHLVAGSNPARGAILKYFFSSIIFLYSFAMAKSTVSTSICFKLLDQTIKAKIYGEEFTASSINLLPEENTVECYGRIFENSEIMKTFGDGTVKDKKWCKERVSFWSEQFNSGNPFGPLLYKSLDENDLDIVISPIVILT